MTDLKSPPEVGTGSILEGRYRLDRTIGEGGMARVYCAEDMALRRMVAIKVMRGPVDGTPAHDRVRSEVTLLASLGHPSLVTLFDAHISATGPSYLVMEYVEGLTLRERVEAGGPLPPDEVAALAVDLAEALHVVHEKGIIHRDIKPSNVLLWPSPLPDRAFRAKLTDFGIAYLLDATRVTAPGTVIGTAAYLAPEQVRGESPTPAADVYGLGLLLLEAITGRRAFAHAVGHEAIVARLTVSPSVPEDLPSTWRVLLTAMTAMNPARRPTALQVALAATSMREPQPSTGEVLAAFMAPAVTAPVAATVAAGVESEPPPVEFPESAPAELLEPAAVALSQSERPPLEILQSPTRTQVLEAATDGGGREHRAPWGRARLVALIALVVALVLGAAIAVGIATTASNEPNPSPTLPAVEEPLGTHLDDLLEAVTP